MRTCLFRMTVLALALVPCLTASIAKGQSTSLPSDLPQIPKGYILIQEDQWDLLADEPGRHLSRARDAFLMSDARLAAAELRKAVLHVKVAADNAAERSKRALVQSERELEQTARRIEAGSLQSVEQLDLATSRALHALANDQYFKATRAWRRREFRQAGQYLQSTANNLECAAAQFDTGMRQATTVVVHDSRAAAGKLVEGTGFVMDEMGKEFESIGTAIERLGHRVEEPVRR